MNKVSEILFLLDFYPPHKWWIENVFEHLINWLLEKWYKITLVTSRFDKALRSEEKIWDLTIYRVWKWRKSFFFKWFLKAWKILEENQNISIIHSSTYTTPITASILAHIFHKKSILTVHEIFGNMWNIIKPWYTAWIYRLYEWIMLIFPHDLYHCVSLYTLNSLRIHTNIPNEKLYLIYNWVDNDFWNKEAVTKSECEERKKQHWLDESFIISYYGHAGKTKWIDLLVDAIPQLLEENPDSKLLFNIIPSKRSENIIQQIENINERLKAWNRIKIFNWFSKEELRVFVASADIIIAPSLAEWFGSVHSEASAMWKNLITSNLAAIPEVVSWNIILMSPPSAKAICESVQRLRKWDFEPITKKNFSRKKMVNEVEELYYML